MQKAERQLSQRSDVAVGIAAAKEKREGIGLLFEQNPLPMWVVETGSGRFLAVNDAAIQHYGYSRERFLPMTLYDIRPRSEHLRLTESLTSRATTQQSGDDWKHLKTDGTLIDVSIFSKLIRYKDKLCKLCAPIDVTEQQRHEAIITHMARHDHLTGLPNRWSLEDRVQQELGRMRASGKKFAVMVPDFDDFKAVNDSFGHDAGDQLLHDIAEWLHSAMRPSDVIARTGGDEFSVIAIDIEDRRDAQEIASRLLRCMEERFICKGQGVSAACSIGITLAPEEGEDADTLFRNADLALYRAKADGKGGYRFLSRVCSLPMLQSAKLRRICVWRSTETSSSFTINLSSISEQERCWRMRHFCAGIIPREGVFPRKGSFLLLRKRV